MMLNIQYKTLKVKGKRSRVCVVGDYVESCALAIDFRGMFIGG